VNRTASLSHATFRRTVLPWALAFFLVVCALGGGSSRADVQGQVIVRTAATVLGALAVVVIRRVDIARLAVPLGLFAAFAFLIALQLVPLPPMVWTSLPGRAFFMEAARSAGLPQPWRPLSLTPDLTLENFVSLFPAFAVLLALAAATSKTLERLLPLWVIIAVASSLLGILQIAGGPASPLYTYAVTSPGDPVGLFANRNHQALLLASALPLVMAWGVSGIGTDGLRQTRVRPFIATAVAILLVLVLIASGSRSGLGLMAIAAVGGGLIIRRNRVGGISGDKRGIVALLTIGAVLVAALLWNARADTIMRLVAQNDVEDLRFSNLRSVLALAWQYFPFGSGFGSFDPMFRITEPDSALSPRYFNNAHNDLLELAIVGGLPALFLLIIFIVWWGRASVRAWRASRGGGPETTLARCASVIIVLFLVESLVDYPLRTALGSVLFVMAVVWLVGRDRAHFTEQ